MAVQDRRSSIAVKVEAQLKTASSVKAEGTVDFSAKLVELDNVSDIPDLGGTPEQLDVTPIGADRRKFINGIIEQDELEFTCFFEANVYNGLIDGGLGLIKITIYPSHADKEAGTNAEMEIWIKGNISVGISGFGVGDALNYTMRVAVEELEFDEALTLA